MATGTDRPVYVTAEQQDQLNRVFGQQYALARKLMGTSSLPVTTISALGEVILAAYSLGRCHERQVNGQ